MGDKIDYDKQLDGSNTNNEKSDGMIPLKCP